MSWRNSAIAAAAALLFASSAAYAGRACDDSPPDPAKTAAAFDNAMSLAQSLDRTGQRVLLLVRQGQDLSKYRVTFSHAAFVAKEDGAWAVYHLLNGCGTAKSNLYRQGLADFLSQDLVSQEVAVVAPQDWLQSRLLQVLASKAEQFRMHHPEYSAVAYPFNTKYQNSNAWVLETYARAASDVLLPGREQAQAWLKGAGYKPDIVELGALARLGGRMFKANVAFDDHPGELRWNGKITTSTGDSVLRFANKHAVDLPECRRSVLGQKVCLVKN